MNYKVESIRQQTKKHNEWLEFKLNNVLPKFMKDEEIDTWLVISREYNDDPALRSLVPLPMVNGDEGLIMPTTKGFMFLVYNLNENNVITYTMIGGAMPFGNDPYEVFSLNNGETEWDCLNRYLSLIKPKKIGLNYSKTFAHCDGLSFTEEKLLRENLDISLVNKVVSAEMLCLRWLQYRSPDEINYYHKLIDASHFIISECFSSKIVTPGITTVEDISWEMRQMIRDLNFSSWFMPMVSFIRKGEQYRSYKGIVNKGDILHCDMGIRYFNLLADTQQLAYILKDNENDVPQGLKQGMKLANNLQDIHMNNMSEGLTGNSILKAIIKEMKENDIEGKVWTHPIGYHGHGAGPLIGTYINQEEVVGRGSVVLEANSCYAMELCVFYNVPEWNNQSVSFNLEETIGFVYKDKINKAVYFKDRQTKYHLI